MLKVGTAVAVCTSDVVKDVNTVLGMLVVKAGVGVGDAASGALGVRKIVVNDVPSNGGVC